MIALHILDATGRLSFRYRWKLKRGFKTAKSKVRKVLPIENVDVVMQALPAFTIEETGVGGYSPSAELAFIYLNPHHPRFTASLDVELVPTIAHELLHCARWRGPGYGTTLGEALVSEGLALHFEILFRGHPPFYSTALSEAQLLKLLEEAEPLFGKTDYGHVAWFVGSPERGIPKYGGYSLAFFIVSKAVLRFQTPALSLWNRPAADFLNLM